VGTLLRRAAREVLIVAITLLTLFIIYSLVVLAVRVAT
jgi:hypothetical protein